jgi:hypothetical protein
MTGGEMRLFQNGRGVMVAMIVTGALVTACAPTYVVVPERREGYAAKDTLHGQLKGKDVRVTFRHVTISRVDTLVRWRTIYRDGPRVDTVLYDTTRKVDTVRVGSEGRRRPGNRVDTVRVVVRDTIRRVDTVRVARRVDTVRVFVPGPGGGTGTGSTGGSGGPTGPIILPRPPADGRIDTVRITIRDTVRITVRDTVRIGSRDTVRITVRDTIHIVDTLRTGGVDTVRIPGRRTLFVPPGQYPPEGQCRVWIYDKPPGQQARAAACNALGPIPAGAFILFGGEAWDFDYDWIADPKGVPPEIIALKRNGGNGRSSAPVRARGRP